MMHDQEILKDLFFIERGYLNGNHFVYRSKSPVLIDIGYASGFDETERRITELGVALSDISLIINTHTHCDHIGGNKMIQERSGCDIALQRVGKHFIDTGNSWATWWRYYNQEADFFHCTRGLEDGETVAVGVKKMLNHLGLWNVKRKPPARANSPPTESFIIYDECSSPGADDYIIDADYPMDTCL